MTASERQVFMTSGGVLGQTWSSLKLALKGRALKFLLGLVPALLLTACSTPGYDCKRGEACAPVHSTYQDAVRAQGSWRPEWDVRGKSFTKKKPGFFAGLYHDVFGGNHKRPKPIRVSIGAGQPQVAAPVYQPPQPWRVWLGPWVGSNGDLHSGEYVWFTTPGHWFYDGKVWPLTTGSGEGGVHIGDRYVSDGVLAPVPPTNLGFTPSLSRTAPGVLHGMTQPQNEIVHRHHNGSPAPAQ